MVEALDVRRCILIRAKAFLISGGSIWCKKKSSRVFEALRSCDYARGAMTKVQDMGQEKALQRKFDKGNLGRVSFLYNE